MTAVKINLQYPLRRVLRIELGREGVTLNAYEQSILGFSSEPLLKSGAIDSIEQATWSYLNREDACIWDLQVILNPPYVRQILLAHGDEVDFEEIAEHVEEMTGLKVSKQNLLWRKAPSEAEHSYECLVPDFGEIDRHLSQQFTEQFSTSQFYCGSSLDMESVHSKKVMLPHSAYFGDVVDMLTKHAFFLYAARCFGAVVSLVFILLVTASLIGVTKHVYDRFHQASDSIQQEIRDLEESVANAAMAVDANSQLGRHRSGFTQLAQAIEIYIPSEVRLRNLEYTQQTNRFNLLAETKNTLAVAAILDSLNAHTRIDSCRMVSALSKKNGLIELTIQGWMQ